MGELNNKFVLDVCSGSGWAATWFAEKGATVVALDLNKEKGGLADVVSKRDHLKQEYDIVQADICRIPFRSETFDIVFCARSLHTLKYPQLLTREAARLIKRDGIFLVMGEPTGKSLAGISSTDPRNRGRLLSLSDYRAIFHEGGLDMKEKYHGDLEKTSSGILSLFRKQIKSLGNESPGLMIGRREKDFELPNIRFPWKKKGE